LDWTGQELGVLRKNGQKLSLPPQVGIADGGSARYRKDRRQGRKRFTMLSFYMPSQKKNFDVKTFLADIGAGRKIICVKKKQRIYAQGAVCDAVFYIQKGKVRLTVVSKTGKEATIAIMNPGDFFGEGGLAGQPRRMGSAEAMDDCELMRIEKDAMMLALHRENKLSDMFLVYLLGKNIRYEADLIDQLFNSSEKRLARILLLLAHFGKERKPDKVIPKISQETLAEMVGTTRSRVSFFMNKFRKMGFIDYNGELEIHSSLLNVILHEPPGRPA
jgi:CRP/FNR family transcriptional regulator, cyclic AMP receptor protein